MNQAINVRKKLRKLDLDRSIPVLIEDRLKERNMGIYENIPFDNLDWNVFWDYNSDCNTRT